MSIDDFAGTKPAFIPEEFFVGHLEGWAVFENLWADSNGGRRFQPLALWKKPPKV